MDLKENRIVLFTNPEKDGPTYTGEAQINGARFSVALWAETSKKGMDYLSGKIEPWHPKATSAQPPASNVDFSRNSPDLKEPEAADDLPY